MTEDRYIVRPLVGALHILDGLRNASLPMGLSDVAEVAGLSKSTAFRYLKTLSLMGYVTQHPNGAYSLGLSALSLAADDSRDGTLRGAAEPEMKALLDEFGETVNLGVPKGKHIHYVAMLESPRPLRLRAESGDADFFHSTALGKAMIAFMPKERVDLHLKSRLTKFTDRTLINRRQLDQALVVVRQYGYAVDREENEIGCVCYAAPIFGADGVPIAALSVSVPSPRLTAELDLAIPEGVKQHATAITTALLRDPMSADRRDRLRSRRGKGASE